jgi:hypothetical protein
MIHVPYCEATNISRHRTKFDRHGDRYLCTPDLKDQAHLNNNDDLFQIPRNHNLSATNTSLLRLAKNNNCSLQQRKEPTIKTLVTFKAGGTQLPLRQRHY